MDRLFQVGLASCIIISVLGFGGTEPFLFLLVQTVAFVLLGLLVWMAPPGKSSWQLPSLGLGLLVGYLTVHWLLLFPTTHSVREHLLRFYAYICVFCVAVYICRSKQGRQWTVRMLLAIGLLEAIYGLVQYFGDWPYILAYQKEFYVDRATGTYINPNHFSGLLELILPLAVAYGLYQAGQTSVAGRSRQESVASRGENVWFLLFLSFAAVLMASAIVFSASRMGIFSVSAALAITGILWLSASWRRWTAILVLASFLLGSILFTVWLGVEPVLERYGRVEQAYLLRRSIWNDSLLLVREHPLRGTGLGTFADHYPRVQTTALTRRVDYAHNDYLQIAVELGVPGVILVFGTVAALLGKSISSFYRVASRRDRYLALGTTGSILALLFHSLADFNLYIPANVLVFVIVLAVAYSLGSAAKQSLGDNHP